MGDWSNKGESGTFGRCFDTNIGAMLLVAGLGYLCVLSSVFTTKTSGVQHQIQDALVVLVDSTQLESTSLYVLLVQSA